MGRVGTVGLTLEKGRTREMQLRMLWKMSRSKLLFVNVFPRQHAMNGDKRCSGLHKQYRHLALGTIQADANKSERESGRQR